MVDALLSVRSMELMVALSRVALGVVIWAETEAATNATARKELENILEDWSFGGWYRELCGCVGV